MKTIADLTKLGVNRDALKEIKERVNENIPVSSFILFGSYSRGEADEESDIDLLVLTERPISNYERNCITDAVFEVNLAYDTNFSTTTADINEWENGIISVMPIYDEVERDGIIV